jgi:mannosyltransferase
MSKKYATDDKRDIPSGKTSVVLEGDLDNGFDAGIHSWKDISLLTIKKALFDSRYLQVLVALTVLGLFLRFYQITFNSIWLDEAYTYFFSKNSFVDIWLITVYGEFNPPLFYWIEHFMLFFGNNEFILRFAPAILGTCTIPLIYFLGKEFMDRNCGIIMAALLTFCPFHIYYSQEARAYTTMLFFLTIALIFYFRALRTNAWRSWVLFGLFSGFAVWSHFYAFIPVVSLFVVALGLNAGKIRNEVRFITPLIKGALLFFVVSLPLLLIVGELFHNRTKVASIWGYQGLDLILRTMRSLSGYLSGSGIGKVMIIYLALFVIGIFTVFMIERKKAFFLIAMISIPLVISWGLSYRMSIAQRYLFFLIPFYFMGIAASYQSMFKLWKSKRVIYLFILVLILINILFLVSYYQTPKKEDWRGLSGTIREVTRPGDIIVVLPACNLLPFDYYYQNQTTAIPVFGETSILHMQESRPFAYYYKNQATGIQEFGVTSIPQLQEIFLQKGENRIFYVGTDYIEYYDPNIPTWLNNHALKVNKFLKPSTSNAYKSIYLYISM